MTRLHRVYAALGDVSNLHLEQFAPITTDYDGYRVISQDFRNGRSQAQLDKDAASVLNEIMGIRDRAQRWLEAQGVDPAKVDAFVRSNASVSLVHDLANMDKHGQLDRKTMSGHKPRLENVSRGLTNIYDPKTGTYAEGKFFSFTIDTWTGESIGSGSADGMEVVITGSIVDENGTKLDDFQKVIPDAIYNWEQFLIAAGLPIV